MLHRPPLNVRSQPAPDVTTLIKVAALHVKLTINSFHDILNVQRALKLSFGILTFNSTHMQIFKYFVHYSFVYYFPCLTVRVDSMDRGLCGSCVVYGSCSELIVKSSGCAEVSGTMCCVSVSGG